MLFANVGIIYSKKNTNDIATLIINNNFQRQKFVLLDNSINNLQTTLSISKYLFSLKSTISVNLSWQLSQFNQLQNGLLLNFNNYISLARLTTSSKINEMLYFNYSANFTHQQSVQRPGSIISNSTQTINQLTQKGELNFSPMPIFNLKIVAENYYNQQSFSQPSNYFFLDATLQYKIVHNKIELEGSVLNIANIKNFTTTAVSANNTTINNYEIRGRIAMIKALFNF